MSGGLNYQRAKYRDRMREALQSSRPEDNETWRPASALRGCRLTWDGDPFPVVTTRKGSAMTTEPLRAIDYNGHVPDDTEPEPVNPAVPLLAAVEQARDQAQAALASLGALRGTA